jgi:hypothetical protein
MSRHLLFINPPVLAVDPYQVCLYAESIPFGLIQLATLARCRGQRVTFIDLMGYLDDDFGSVLHDDNFWDFKPIGAIGVGAKRATYRYGGSLQQLAERLDGLEPPDEILVTCCISFNYEPAHAIIRLCRQRFPRARIRLGGFYPSLFSEHARSSGADEVHAGPHAEAERCFPDLDILEQPPPLWLFRLVQGCRYRCSFCVNRQYRKQTVADPAAVADEVLRIHQRFGVRTFSCWDPNVILRPDILEAFLEHMIAAGAPVELKFEMGVQPDRLTPELARKMKRAGVRAMTIPFESIEAGMMKRFGKPYRIDAAMDAVAMCRELGFDTGHFHCTSVLGIRGESLRHLFGTYFAILKAGGLPTPFPLSFTPGTREYALHRPYLEGKDLAALNGHLWPALADVEQIQRYDLMYAIINQPDPQRAAALARDLPPEAAAAFERELDWFQQGPHRPGQLIPQPPAAAETP